MKTYHVDFVKDHWVADVDGRKCLIDTGCPVNINDENKNQIAGLAEHLEDARRNVALDIAEFLGMEFFNQHKVLLDYKNAKVVVADPSENIAIENPVAEFILRDIPGRIVFNANVGGVVRCMIFDTGASVTDYLSGSTAKPGMFTASVIDFRPAIGEYSVDRYMLPVKIGRESVDIPFGIQTAQVEPYVRCIGADGVIGVGLYSKYQVLIDFSGKKMVLGK